MKHRPWIIVVLVILFALACGGTRKESPNSGGDTQPPTSQTVVYRVDSNTAKSHVKLTYANETGATVQEDAITPWKKTFKAGSGQFLYVSAQLNDDKSLHATCQVMAAGKVLQNAESKGRYVIASCKGTVK